MGRVTKDWSILLSRRINNPDGSFAGIALGSLPFVKDFSSIFATLDIGSHGSLTLRDGDNDMTVILRYTPKKGAWGIGSTAISSEILTNLRNNPNSGTYTAIAAADNVERLFTHRKIGPYPWYIIVGLSTDDYLAQWRKEAAILLFLLASFTLTSILFTRSVMFRLKETIAKELEQERNDKLEVLVREQTAQLKVEKLATEAATQRQQAAEALADSQNLLDSIINSTPDLIWTVDTETFGLITFNKGILEYFFNNFGLYLTSGLRPIDLFPSEEYANKWEEFYQRAIQDGSCRMEYATYSGGLVLDLNFNAIKRDNIVTGISVFGRDITQSKKYEATLRANEARLVTAIEIAGIYLYDGSGLDASQRLITFSDDRTRKILGIPPDQEYRTQDYWLEHIHQDDLQNIVIPALNRFEEQGENLVSAEYRYYNEQRGWLWFRHVAYALNRDDKGNVTRLVGAFQEISEQKRVMEETRQNEARMASLLRISQYPYSSIQDLLDFTLSEAIALTESKIGYIYYYDETLRQFTLNTWSKDVMKECSILDKNSTYELDNTGLWGEVVRQRRPIIVNDFKTENPHKKGYPEGHAPLHSFMTIPVFSKDSIVAVVGVANKIEAYETADVQQLSLMMDAVWRMVEQERSDRAFIASETKYRTLLETIELIAIMLDTDGTIVFCNNYLLNLTGWVRDEILGKNWFELFLSEEVRGEVSEAFWGILESQNISHNEYRIICKDGKERTIFWNNTLLHDADGNITGVASIGNDLTEHRASEDQLRQAQKMEGIGQLAGGVAHDFNNILTVISGYCSLLAMDGGLSNEQIQKVEAITASADRAAQLTHGLLAFSRKQPLVMKQENLNDIVQHVHKFLARIIGEDIKLYTTCCGEKLPVNADKGQIEQIFMNLATNARDAMPKGGIFSIKTDLAELDHPVVMPQDISMPPGWYAVVTVSDTGSGICKEHLDQIFEPFFTTKEVGKGTGLGMSIIYGIVKQHRGFINVYSEIGVGTTFRIYLPLDDKQKISLDDHAVIAPPKGGNETILVAEDEPAVRSLVEKVLSKYGYSIILAGDGQDAIDKFMVYKDDISLIMLDMIMPKKNGREAYEEICRIRSDIKVLFSSGYTADFMENRGISEEGVELITKPVKPLELLRKIRQMLDE